MLIGGVVERRLAGGILNVGIHASPQPLLHRLHVTCHSNVEERVPQDDLPAAIRTALREAGDTEPSTPQSLKPAIPTEDASA